jgi:hypothetical protein
MSRAGDKDHSERGASVAQLVDARRRRSPPGNVSPASPQEAPPTEGEPSAGTHLITNTDIGSDGELLPGGLADDVLDQVLARSSVPPAPERGSPSPPSSRDQPLDGAAVLDREYDDVQDQIERHHERGQPRRLRSAPRGSADLAPAQRQRSSRRPLRSQPGASSQRVRSGRRRLALVVTAALALGAAAVVVGAVTDSGPGRHTSSARQLTAAINVHGAATIARVVASATTLVADITSAKNAQATADRHARARAKAAARARTARTRRRRHPTLVRVRATVPASRSAATSTPTQSTIPSGSPSTSSATGSGGTGSSSGSTSLPAGPTGIGSAGSNCNPKCS